MLIHAHKGVERAKNIANEIKAAGGSAEVVSFDISDDEQVRVALEKVLKEGSIQILINNAGMHHDCLMAGMSSVVWSEVVNTNLNGFYRVTQPLLLPMIRTRWGRIITISSVAGLTGNRGQANYAAAKAGIHGASKSLALEIANRGITVNVIAPGVIDTEMSDSVFSNEKIKEMIPAGRKGQPSEVAALVKFLVSDDAGYITGQVISINGGLC